MPKYPKIAISNRSRERRPAGFKQCRSSCCAAARLNSVARKGAWQERHSGQLAQGKQVLHMPSIATRRWTQASGHTKLWPKIAVSQQVMSIYTTKNNLDVVHHVNNRFLYKSYSIWMHYITDNEQKYHVLTSTKTTPNCGWYYPDFFHIWFKNTGSWTAPLMNNCYLA